MLVHLRGSAAPRLVLDRPEAGIGAGREITFGAILVLAALSLTLLEYLGASNRAPAPVLQLVRSLRPAPGSTAWPALLQPLAALLAEEQLIRLGWWSCSCFLYYFALPALFIRLVLRRRVRDFGLAWQGLSRHLPLYVLLFLLVLPAVVAASFSNSFKYTYPFFDNAHRSWLHFAAWELLYLQQFFSLEFFFRGFMIQGLGPRLGLLAVPVMMVPYCMLHFGKPMPEALGAIIAGLVLGLLSYLTRSIWCGLLLHASVAVSMDLLALGQRGLLGRLLG
ncbi:MAG: CPBP family intramembrane metalloprotease [Deltaproteobacteria bacterium]|nr:CPBP family intramembrane metalloprotease [Deltaproteobacteria bacterium]